MKFKELNLSDYIIQGLDKQGIETATEIQHLAFPLIKSGVDVIGLSQTGSGKTYAFGIPMLENLDKERQGVQALIVCPTRELAVQVADDLRKLTGFTTKISIATIFGGSDINRQTQLLRRGAKIVVGTPGRLMDHLRRGTLKLDSLQTVILDEADEMLNMGFKEDIETILKTTPDTRQTVMFSATMPQEIIRITKQYMKEPTMVKAKDQESAPALIKQYYVNCKRAEKTQLLNKIYEKFNPWIAIVFCNTIQMTEDLSKALKKDGLPAVCLNGDMRQNERKRVMDKFKKSDNGGILVATDVAARGIDIKNVDIVINYDFPNNEDYYVHRIGRTGRAGKEGIALTLINHKNQLKDLHALTSKDGSTIEEYATLSTTQWSTEPKKTNARTSNTRQNTRPISSKQNRNAVGHKFKSETDKRPTFKKDDRNKPYKNQNTRHPKSQKIQKDEHGHEVFEIGGGFLHHDPERGKTRYTKQNRAGKTPQKNVTDRFNKKPNTNRPNSKPQSPHNNTGSKFNNRHSTRKP